MYKRMIRPLFFKFNPEAVHHFVLFWMKIPVIRWIFKLLFYFDDPRLRREFFGITFKNPVGLGAGFDKNAEVIDGLAALGFGFLEIGTVTPKAQPGNPKPRLFRLIADKGLINRMGFNNDGVAAAVTRLKKSRSGVVIAGNIGKNKITPNENAADDYLQTFNALFEHVHFFVVNVSSPNTPNLRELQEKEPLKKLLVTLQFENRKKRTPKPILLKIAPDLSDGQIDDIVEIVLELQLDGVVATNTTIERNELQASDNMIKEIGEGGLSGKPLGKRATEVIRQLRQKLGPEVPIIGVGGIFTAEDALEKLQAGASLVEIYTGFIYQGPGIVKKINKSLVKAL